MTSELQKPSTKQRYLHMLQKNMWHHKSFIWFTAIAPNDDFMR